MEIQPITIKLHQPGGEIRRFQARPSSHAALLGTIKEHTGAAPEALYYVDDEQDMVTLANDWDLQEALRLLPPNGILHLHLQRPVQAEEESGSPTPTPAPQQATKEPSVAEAPSMASSQMAQAAMLAQMMMLSRGAAPPPSAAAGAAAAAQPQAPQPQPAATAPPPTHNPLGSIMGLANSPMAAGYLQMLGLTPALVGSILRGEQEIPPHILALLGNFGVSPAAAKQMLASLGAQGAANSSVNNDNNDDKGNNNDNNAAAPAAPPLNDWTLVGGNDAEDKQMVSICDVCDGVIAADSIRWSCAVCPEYDMHPQCRHTHAEDHPLFTQYASEEQLAQLLSLGFSNRDLCIETLNNHKGDLQQALNHLLALQNVE